MKITALIALVTLTLASASFAHAYEPCDPTPRDRSERPGDIDHHTGAYPRCQPQVIATCAPEVVEGNVAATERTLKTLSASLEFASAADFKSVVSKISAEKNQNAKVAKYFALIGVDSTKSADVADFVGAREVKSRWVSALERSTNLSASQADTVARQLQTTLRGNLQ